MLVELGLLPLHQGLYDRLGHVPVALADKAEAQGEGGIGALLEGKVGVDDLGEGYFLEVGPGPTGVGHPQSQDGALLDNLLVALVDGVREEGEGNVIVIVDPRAADANTKTGASFDPLALVIKVCHEVIVDGGSVPGAEQPEASNGCDLRLLIDLQDKAVLLLFLLLSDHEGVLGEPGINEGIDVDAVEGGGLYVPALVILLEMHLEDVPGLFGLVHLEILRQLKVELGEHAVGDDVVELLPQFGDVDLLAGRAEGELLLDEVVGALGKDLPDLVVIVKLDGHSEGDGVLRELEGQVV